MRVWGALLLVALVVALVLVWPDGDERAARGARELDADTRAETAGGQTVPEAGSDAPPDKNWVRKRGIVQDTKERRIPGARVLAVVFDSGEVELGQQARILQETRTGADGTFELRANPLIREARVVAHAPGYAWGGTGARDLYFTEGPVTVVLALDAGRIEGKVLDDATGLPITDARVDLLVSDDAILPDLVRSGRDGSFRFEGVSVDGVVVGVAAPDYVPRLVDVEPAAGETKRVEVRLRRGIRLHGTVRSGITGDPIAGARVYSSEWPALYAVTDKTGRYKFGGIGTEEDVLLGYLHVRAPGHVPESRDLQVRIPKGIERLRMDFDCRRAAQLEAFATDGEGRPMAGVVAHYLEYLEFPDDPSYRAVPQTTGENGRVLFDHIEPGTAGELWLLAPDRYDTSVEFEPLGPGLVRLGRVELVSKTKTAPLRGRVVNTGGSARVRLGVVSHAYELVNLGAVFVKADSTFEIEAPAKRTVILHAVSDAGESAYVEVLVPETGVTLEEPLVIVDVPPRRETPETYIQVRFAGSRRFALLAKKPGGTWRMVDFYAHESNILWPHGRCTFVAVGLSVVSRPTTANIGEVTEVRLEGRGPTADQRFVVVDRKGAPVRGVQVEIAQQNAAERKWIFDRIVTGADGVAVAKDFPALADWRLTLEVRDGERSLGIFPYSPERGVMTLAVGGEVRLRIHALDAHGAPVLGAFVTVSDAAYGDSDPERVRIDPRDPDLTRVNNEDVTDRNGVVRWEPLPCGPYVLEVEHTGYKSVKRELDLTEPGEQVIEIVLKR